VSQSHAEGDSATGREQRSHRKPFYRGAAGVFRTQSLLRCAPRSWVRPLATLSPCTQVHPLQAAHQVQVGHLRLQAHQHSPAPATHECAAWRTPMWKVATTGTPRSSQLSEFPISHSGKDGQRAPGAGRAVPESRHGWLAEPRESAGRQSCQIEYTHCACMQMRSWGTRPRRKQCRPRTAATALPLGRPCPGYPAQTRRGCNCSGSS